MNDKKVVLITGGAMGQGRGHAYKYAKNNCCKVIDIMESPLLGAKKQNKEFLIWCKYEKE